MPALLALALLSLQVSGVHHAYEHGIFSNPVVSEIDPVKSTDLTQKTHNCVMFDGVAQAFFATSTSVTVSSQQAHWPVPEFYSQALSLRDLTLAYSSRAPPKAI